MTITRSTLDSVFPTVEIQLQNATAQLQKRHLVRINYILFPRMRKDQPQGRGDDEVKMWREKWRHFVKSSPNHRLFRFRLLGSIPKDHLHPRLEKWPSMGSAVRYTVDFFTGQAVDER